MKRCNERRKWRSEKKGGGRRQEEAYLRNRGSMRGQAEDAKERKDHKRKDGTERQAHEREETRFAG